MNKTVVLLGLVLLALGSAGCLEVDVRVQMFEPGQGVITHQVSLPRAVVGMQGGGNSPSLEEMEKQLNMLATADTGAIAGLQKGPTFLRSENDKITLTRTLMFRDGQALAGYLDLLGLKVSLTRKTLSLSSRLKSSAFTADAPNLDIKKLARLGDSLSTPPPDSPITFRLTVTLPGKVERVVPENTAAGNTAVWTCAGNEFSQPFHREFVAATEGRSIDRLGQPADFDGARADTLLAGLTDVAFLQRLGNRSYPLLHVRLDKKLNTDLAVLTVTDDMTGSPAMYQQRVDEVLLPELTANYYVWGELAQLGGQSLYAGGWRARETTAAAKLNGPLRVSRAGGRVVVSFTPPRMLNAPDGQADSPERIVAAILVTYPDGSEQSAYVRVKHLRTGQTVEVGR